jgi:hypothetical protein
MLAPDRPPRRRGATLLATHLPVNAALERYRAVVAADAAAVAAMTTGGGGASGWGGTGGATGGDSTAPPGGAPALPAIMDEYQTVMAALLQLLPFGLVRGNGRERGEREAGAGAAPAPGGVTPASLPSPQLSP